MMAFGDSDLGVFAADMGVSVSFGGVTVRGLLDETDLPAVTADGQVEGIVHGTTLAISAPDRSLLVNAGLTIDSILIADGRSFAVREFLRVDDGRFSHIMVAEVTSAPVPVDTVTITDG